MSSSRDDFGIALRSALLKKGARQKFSLVFLINYCFNNIFLDVYNFKFIKPTRSLINDGIYRFQYFNISNKIYSNVIKVIKLNLTIFAKRK